MTGGRVAAAVERAADVDQADVGFTAVPGDAHIPPPRFAGPGVPRALEVAADDHTRALEAAEPGAGALLDLDVAAHGDIALEEGRAAALGVDASLDARRLQVAVDRQRPAPSHGDAAGDIRPDERAARARGDRHITGDAAGQGPVAGGGERGWRTGQG